MLRREKEPSLIWSGAEWKQFADRQNQIYSSLYYIAAIAISLLITDQKATKIF